MEGDLFDALDDIDVAIAEGELDEAESLLAEARESFGDDPELTVAEADLALERGAWEECIELVDAATSDLAAPVRAELLAMKGYALFYDDREDSARETLNEAVGDDPECWRAIVGRATVHDFLGFPHAAELDLDRAIELDDQDPEPFRIRGAVHLQLGRREEAERDFEAALEFDPGDEAARLQLGRLSALDDRASRAMEILDPLVRDGDDPDLRMRAALLRSQMAVSLGSEGVALDEAGVAQEVAPDQPWGWLQAAAAHLAASDPDAALEVLDEAEDRTDEPGALPDLHELRATACERLGRDDEARDHRQRVRSAAVLPGVVYGPELDPVGGGGEATGGALDVESILTELFGSPDHAPPGYADEVRDILEKIPEVAREHPEAAEVEIELPPLEEGGESPGDIVVQLEGPFGG